MALNVKTILGVVIAINLMAVFCFFILSKDPAASVSNVMAGTIPLHQLRKFIYSVSPFFLLFCFTRFFSNETSQVPLGDRFIDLKKLILNALARKISRLNPIPPTRQT